MNPQKHLFLSQEIIKYLNSKEGKSDDLNGIVFAIYRKEMKQLGEKIIISLADLIADGMITELKKNNGKQYYKLIQPFNNEDNI